MICLSFPLTRGRLVPGSRWCLPFQFLHQLLEVVARPQGFEVGQETDLSCYPGFDTFLKR